jgi:transposase InsO family protein
MSSNGITVETLVNRHAFASTLIDTGNLAYSLISPRLVKRAGLQCLSISPRRLEGVTEESGTIRKVARLTIDIEGYKDTIWGYVSPTHPGYDLILGRPWMNKRQVTIAPSKRSIYIHSTHQRIRLISTEDRPISKNQRLKRISAVAYYTYIRHLKKDKPVQIFAASLQDIEKALAPKKKVNVMPLLPKAHQHMAWIFDPKTAARMPPIRGPEIDHRIELEKDEHGKEKEPPWGPLYNMSRGELLVLRKELISLLDKGWIRTSSSPAASPVLFAKKPGGGLRFCVDYRALNAITKKDRYPLPLIQETFNNITKAKWFTKIDVSAAFHKIRINAGDEWKTAFRTRFGLYEWLVTPFGMANAPSTFQRYINWTLRKYIDNFCSAYLDDVLIYTDGTRKEHQRNTNKVLEAMGKAGLPLDITKCEFDVKSTKYLGFVIEAGKGLRMDPEKVKAIKEWEAPVNVKGVRSFLGFANFYRRFIKNYSGLTAPLTRLTGDVPFQWGETEQQAFDKLKEIFVTEPVLAQWDPDKETILETDSSGYVVAGVLSQYDNQGLLRPVAYYSKKMTCTQSNYEIHDKELLAVICCIAEWDGMLRSLQKFTVITDHKNLEYFGKPRQLSERQMRWAQFLGKFPNMEIAYRPGVDNVRADALSRRHQDMPINSSDDRISRRFLQIFKPTTATTDEELADDEALRSFRCSVKTPVIACYPVSSSATLLAQHRLEQLWEEAKEGDQTYQSAWKAVKDGERKFPTVLDLKLSIAECCLDESGNLLYRDRKWVPESEPLRTGIIHAIHASRVLGHPGRNLTYQAVAREYFWPSMSKSVRQYVRNCSVCGRVKPWRDGLQGLLRPLPIPERIWKEVSIDFMIDLPESDGCTNLMVVTDRLSKDVVLVGLGDITTDSVAKAYINHVVAYHWLPDYITSDRGPQFVSHMWTKLCELTGVERRLSSGYHPETDGSTERMNATVQAYLRAFCDWGQTNWKSNLGMAKIAITARQAQSTKMSPFFMQHGYEVDPLQIAVRYGPENRPRGRRVQKDYEKAERIVEKLRQSIQLAQATMGEAQQEQERQANQRRKQSPQLRVGDKVWLKLGDHYKTKRPSRKLDWKNAKYTVLEIVGPNAVKLNTPGRVHPVFNVNMLRLASSDPLPSQPQDDNEPEPIEVDGEEMYLVEEILKEKGDRQRKQYLVKWEGYSDPTWEPASSLKHTNALQEWKHAQEEGSQPKKGGTVRG